MGCSSPRPTPAVHMAEGSASLPAIAPRDTTTVSSLPSGSPTLSFVKAFFRKSKANFKNNIHDLFHSQRASSFITSRLPRRRSTRSHLSVRAPLGVHAQPTGFSSEHSFQLTRPSPSMHPSTTELGSSSVPSAVVLLVDEVDSCHHIVVSDVSMTTNLISPSSNAIPVPPCSEVMARGSLQIVTQTPNNAPSLDARVHSLDIELTPPKLAKSANLQMYAPQIQDTQISKPP